MDKKRNNAEEDNNGDGSTSSTVACQPPTVANEHGGRGGLDPTRFGDWEIKGKCVDF